MALADLPLTAFLDEALIPYEEDEVTRLIHGHPRRRGLRPGQAPDGRRIPRLAARLRQPRSAGGAGARADARDGGGGQQADAQPGSDRWWRASAGSSRASATRIGLPGRTVDCGCSPTTRPTIRAGIAASDARRPAATAAATRSSASTRPPTASTLSSDLLRCWIDHRVSATRSRPSPACWRTSPPRIAAIERGAPGGSGVPVDRRHRGGQPRASASRWRCCDEARRGGARRCGAAPWATT